ncbi:unnamed protein product [Linum trigynum]|uniref:Uncharacterized protein n=1 Tax=Linum trigynum TaxID=586398 RepID=A0AAV2D495_9ROSI
MGGCASRPKALDDQLPSQPPQKGSRSTITHAKSVTAPTNDVAATTIGTTTKPTPTTPNLEVEVGVATSTTDQKQVDDQNNELLVVVSSDDVVIDAKETKDGEKLEEGGNDVKKIKNEEKDLLVDVEPQPKLNHERETDQKTSSTPPLVTVKNTINGGHDDEATGTKKVEATSNVVAKDDPAALSLQNHKKDDDQKVDVATSEIEESATLVEKVEEVVASNAKEANVTQSKVVTITKMEETAMEAELGVAARHPKVVETESKPLLPPAAAQPRATMADQSNREN